MFSIGLTMRVRPGRYEEYKRYHDELWPELARGMSDAQVSMAIFRFGDRLFLHATAPTQEHWERSRRDPVLDKWQDVMATLLETDAEGRIDFERLEHAFRFGDFA